jgi:hypothetical protein
MKHTAVQWLEIVLIPDPISEEEFEHNINCWKQAKEMEKEQIINANRDGVDMVVDKKDFILGEQYYNETFNTNEK